MRNLRLNKAPTLVRRLGAAVAALGLVATGSVALAVPASATGQGPTHPVQNPYVVAVWAMPSWIDSTHPTWPQQLVGSVQSNTADLAAANGIIPTKCGTQYQVDVYLNNETTALLLQGGYLNGPNNPPESLAPGSWGTAYKLVKNQDCTEAQTVTPAAPTFTDATCDNDGGSYTIPSTPGVDYQISGKTVTAGTYPATGKVTIKAVAKPGFVLAGTTSWSHKFTPAEDCTTTVVPKAPTAVATECTDGQQPDGSYTIPSVDGVTYEVDGTVTPAGTYPLTPGAQVTITAIPEKGFTFAGDAVDSWTLSNPKLDCTEAQIVTPAAPTFTDATCDNDGGTYTIPSTPGVDYQISGKTVTAGTYPATGKVTIKAVAQAGYVLHGDTSWSHKFRPAEDCEHVAVPKAPKVVASECTEGQQSNGSYTIPSVEGVRYKVDGSVTPAGTYPLAPGQQVTVTAFPKSGFTFGEGTVHSWTLSNPKLDCSVPQPPATLPEVIGPGPANPQAEVEAICAKASVELKNLTPQTTDLPATFQIAVNGTAWKTVTVQAGEVEKVVYKPTSNPYTVTVTAESMPTVTGTTATLSCVEAVVIPGAKPPAVEPAVVPAELPHTGASSLPLALAGAGLLLLGTVLVASTRRRRGDLAA